MGAFLLSQTMERRPEIGLDSYDRFFPSQDTLPRGGFGNLIALPLQKKPREYGNSLFVNEQFDPYPDQWAFLASLQRMSSSEMDAVVRRAEKQDELLGIRLPVTDEEDDRPWAAPPSRKRAEQPVVGQLPVAVLVFDAVMASRSLHLPGSGVSNLLVTVIAAACTGVTVNNACAHKIRITTKPVNHLRNMGKLLSRTWHNVLVELEEIGRVIFLFQEGQSLKLAAESLADQF